MRHSPLTGDNPFYRDQLQEGWLDDTLNQIGKGVHVAGQVFKHGSTALVGSLDLNDDGRIDKKDYYLASYITGEGLKIIAKAAKERAKQIKFPDLYRMSRELDLDIDMSGVTRELVKDTKKIASSVSYLKQGEVEFLGDPRAAREIKGWISGLKEGQELAGYEVVKKVDAPGNNKWQVALGALAVIVGLDAAFKVGLTYHTVMGLAYLLGGITGEIIALQAMAAIFSFPFMPAILIIGGTIYILKVRNR